MNIVHFSTRLSDGAGRATYRLHKGLIGLGVNSICIVKHKEENDDTVIKLFRNNLSNPLNHESTKSNVIKHTLETIPFLFREFVLRYKTSKYEPASLFNFNIPFIDLDKINNIIQSADIICLHSIQYFLSTDLIGEIYEISKAPIIWTMMDIEPITGGCHFNNNCEKYIAKCGDCPQLKLSKNNDLSRLVWTEKHKTFSQVPITLVAPTSNAQRQAKSSSLFREKRVEKILLSTDDTFFQPVEKKVARQALNIPEDKKIVLFGAYNLSDDRKGGDLLLDAFKLLSDRINNSAKLKDNIVLLTIGEKNKFDASNLPVEWIHLGRIYDNRLLKLVYYAADIYACPSRDDMGPLMINEAYSCGLPIIAFDFGVGPDLITSTENGFLIKNLDVTEFAECLYKFFVDESVISILNEKKNVQMKCSQSNQAKTYLKLFDSIKNG